MKDPFSALNLEAGLLAWGEQLTDLPAADAAAAAELAPAEDAAEAAEPAMRKQPLWTIWTIWTSCTVCRQTSGHKVTRPDDLKIKLAKTWGSTRTDCHGCLNVHNKQSPQVSQVVCSVFPRTLSVLSTYTGQAGCNRCETEVCRLCFSFHLRQQ